MQQQQKAQKDDQQKATEQTREETEETAKKTIRNIIVSDLKTRFLKLVSSISSCILFAYFRLIIALWNLYHLNFNLFTPNSGQTQ